MVDLEMYGNYKNNKSLEQLCFLHYRFLCIYNPQ